MTAALSATAASPGCDDTLLSNSSTGASQVSTGPTGVQLSAVTTAASRSSVEEWDLVRIGSMRQHALGASSAMSRSSPARAAAASCNGALPHSASGLSQMSGSSVLWRSGQQQQLQEVLPQGAQHAALSGSSRVGLSGLAGGDRSPHGPQDL